MRSPRFAWVVFLVFLRLYILNGRRGFRCRRCVKKLLSNRLKFPVWVWLYSSGHCSEFCLFFDQSVLNEVLRSVLRQTGSLIEVVPLRFRRTQNLAPSETLGLVAALHGASFIGCGWGAGNQLGLWLRHPVSASQLVSQLSSLRCLLERYLVSWALIDFHFDCCCFGLCVGCFAC
jgi:hypothetical protein